MDSKTEEPTIQKKRMTIFISQVAPLIGLDNYGNFYRIVCELWRRFNPIEFKEFELRLKSEGHTLANSSETNEILKIDTLLGTNILEQVQIINNNTAKTSTDMIKSQNVISNYITHQNLSEDKKTELIKKVNSITNKSHGISNENAILNEFCKLSGKIIQDTQGLVEIPLSAYGAHNFTGEDSINIELEWVIIGKFDGITTDGELIEAKMRQKGLFKNMRDYENVQVQLYMYALGFINGFLVEGFSKTPTKKKNADSHSNIVIEPSIDTTKSELILYTHEIVYDANYVKEIILSRLVRFTKYFTRLLKDTIRKENILKCDSSEWAKYLEEYLDIPQIEF